MYHEFFRQWTQGAKSVTDFNFSTMNEMAQNYNNIWGPGNIAKIMKEFIDSGVEIKNTVDSAMDKAVENQMGAMKLKPTGDAAQKLSAIVGDTMTRLTQTQAAMVGFWGEFSKTYLEAFSKSRTIAELFTVPITMLPNLPKEVSEQYMEPISVMNSYLSAMEIWSTESLNNIADDAKTTPKKKSAPAAD